MILPREPQLFSGIRFCREHRPHTIVGRSMEQILNSLRSKLMHLPDETIVHPGHAPSPRSGTSAS